MAPSSQATAVRVFRLVGLPLHALRSEHPGREFAVYAVKVSEKRYWHYDFLLQASGCFMVGDRQEINRLVSIQFISSNVIAPRCYEVVKSHVY